MTPSYPLPGPVRRTNAVPGKGLLSCQSGTEKRGAAARSPWVRGGFFARSRGANWVGRGFVRGLFRAAAW